VNRRGFLGGIGAVVAGGAALALPKVAAAHPGELEHNGYRVQWADFVTPVNQGVMFGVWRAKHKTKDLQWASTTLGQCYPTRDWEVLDLTRARDWPMLTTFSTEAEKAEVKERARKALFENLT